MLTGCNFLPYPTTMLLLVVTTFGKLGPSAQGFLQSLADVACSTGVVDRGSVSYTHLTLPTILLV